MLRPLSVPVMLASTSATTSAAARLCVLWVLAGLQRVEGRFRRFTWAPVVSLEGGRAKVGCIVCDEVCAADGSALLRCGGWLLAELSELGR
jgi:hypothetical protein